MAFTYDNLGAYVSDYKGSCKSIKWKKDVTNRYDFDYSNLATQVGQTSTHAMCLTKDNKYLLVIEATKLRIFDTLTMDFIKEFYLDHAANGIK